METPLIYLRAAWKMWRNDFKWRLTRLYKFKMHRLLFWTYSPEERYSWCVQIAKHGLSDKVF